MKYEVREAWQHISTQEREAREHIGDEAREHVGHEKREARGHVQHKAQRELQHVWQVI